MSSATVALGVVVVVFAGGVVGLSLQHALPEKYTAGGTRDLIERVVGLLTVLTTLVLGLMIWTAMASIPVKTQRCKVLPTGWSRRTWRWRTTVRTPQQRAQGSARV